MKHTITQTTTRALYGPKNPLLDQNIEDSFWRFDSTAGPLLMNLAPIIIARTAVKARTIIEKAFINYYNNGGLNEASALAKAKYDPPLQYGAPVQDSTRLDMLLLVGALSSSAPADFWTLGQICAKPDLLADLRFELASVITADANVPESTFIVEIDRLKTKYPLLLSVFQEIFHTLAFFSVARMVLEDTVTEDRYLLKKGCLLLVPCNVIHFSTTAWGPQAAEYDFRRFMPKETRTRQVPHTFRGFGGPPNLCPGRQFASTEILTIVATTLMRYDIEPKSGVWALPEKTISVFPAVAPPAGDMKVDLKPRKGWQWEWVFKLGDPAARVPLLCG